MHLMLKARPVLHSRSPTLSLCLPKPRSTISAAPRTGLIRASLNERPIWPPPDDKDKEGQQPEASPAGMGRQGYKSGQQDDKGTLSPPELTKTITGCTDLDSLDQVIKVHGKRFNHMHVNAAMNKVVHKLKGQDQEAMAHGMMQELSGLALRNSMKPRELSGVLWAIAKVGGPVNPALVVRILHHTKEYFATSNNGVPMTTKEATFNAHDISNLLYAMAKLGLTSNDVLIHEIMGAATRELPEFGSQALANTLWALATMVAPLDGPFLEGWIERAFKNLRGFVPQELSNILWAAAKLGIEERDFTIACLGMAELKLHDFNVQGLANTLWAAAKLYIANEAFIGSWLSEATPKLHNFNAQDLSNTMWAVAKLGIEDKSFTTACLGMAMLKLSDFTAQGLSNTLWAAAKLDIVNEAFIAAWLSVAKPVLHDFNHVELRQISTAIASRGSWNIDTGFKNMIAARLG